MTAKINGANPAGPSDSYDVAVVGCGVIGLSCAWSCARSGLSVAAIDRVPGGRTSSRIAAGMLAPAGEATLADDRLVALNSAAAGAWPAFVDDLRAESGLDVPYERFGSLEVALDRDEAESLRRERDRRRAFGLEADWLSPGEVRELERGLTPSCGPGLSAPSEAATEPAALMDALERAAALAGVARVEGSVERLATVGGRIAGAEVAGDVIRADSVLLAAGAELGRAPWLPPEVRLPLRPVRGEILSLRSPAGPPAERIVKSERVYVVPRREGRFVVGATMAEVGYDPRVTAGGVHELLREAYRLLPEIAEAELCSADAGLRPATPDNLPVVGRSPLPGLLYAAGSFRNGILQAPLVGEAIVAHIAGDEPPGALAAADPARLDPARETSAGGPAA